jgi:peptide/nickel transport system permease protein
MKKNIYLIVGLLIIGSMAAIAIFAPLISPYDPGAIDRENLLSGPSAVHLLGTDSLGRDLLSRLIHGARISLS